MESYRGYILLCHSPKENLFELLGGTKQSSYSILPNLSLLSDKVSHSYVQYCVHCGFREYPSIFLAASDRLVWSHSNSIHLLLITLALIFGSLENASSPPIGIFTISKLNTESFSRVLSRAIWSSLLSTISFQIVISCIVANFSAATTLSGSIWKNSLLGLIRLSQKALWSCFSTKSQSATMQA